jgi:sugar (pentulose or hexulose) kinase
MYLGLDFGTSGARACVIDESETLIHEDHIDYPNSDKQTTDNWRAALHTLLSQLPGSIATQLKRIAIDATSSTVLLCDAELQPVSTVLLYNDSRAQAQAQSLKIIAPEGHTVCSASSGLAKFLWLIQHSKLENAAYFMHQADWLSALLSGMGGISDYHNALKSGYDTENLCWPAWVMRLPHSHLLPEVGAPGHQIGKITPTLSAHFNINPDCTIHAGTTDSIAAFIAAGCQEPGAAVTSLGSTIVLKLLSTTRVESAEHGVYSHRFGDLWLAGGASNAGGCVLHQFFSTAQLAELSLHIDGLSDSPLDYYPLPKMGERFPYNDPTMQPRLFPRPHDDVAFLHGLLQGLSRIETVGYNKLEQLGATPLQSVLSSGGGSRNAAWQKIRTRMLGVPVSTAAHTQAAYGSALLAKRTAII